MAIGVLCPLDISSHFRIFSLDILPSSTHVCSPPTKGNSFRSNSVSFIIDLKCLPNELFDTFLGRDFFSESFVRRVYVQNIAKFSALQSHGSKWFHISACTNLLFAGNAGDKVSFKEVTQWPKRKRW